MIAALTSRYATFLTMPHVQKIVKKIILFMGKKIEKTSNRNVREIVQSCEFRTAILQHPESRANMTSEAAPIFTAGTIRDHATTCIQYYLNTYAQHPT
jgi:hypothetical protein